MPGGRLWLTWLLAGICWPLLIAALGGYGPYLNFGDLMSAGWAMIFPVMLIFITPALLSAAVFVWLNRNSHSFLRVMLSGLLVYTLVPIAVFISAALVGAYFAGHDPIQSVATMLGPRRPAGMIFLIKFWILSLIKFAVPAIILFLAVASLGYDRRDA
tara:strand:+ start:27160 stop:27633 length:474 start_codon:yes stop_codon:yes gene_type:complete